MFDYTFHWRSALKALPDMLEGAWVTLETAALSPPARRAIEEPRKRLKALREAGATLSGVEVPKLTELRRVSPTSIVMAAATFLGFYLIVAQFAGVDLAATLEDADWAWVLVAALLSFVPQFSGAIALMGTVSRPLPFGPVLAEQFANGFDAAKWVGEHAAALNGGVAVAALLGVLVQRLTSPRPETAEKDEPRKSPRRPVPHAYAEEPAEPRGRGWWPWAKPGRSAA